MEFIPCNKANYAAGRGQGVRYIVLHYTANNGDTAKNNCDYYARTAGLQASAHYFADEHGVMQSVAEGDTAWHCGARAYWHPECRNGNSIGIEMCSRKHADGSYYILPETVANAAALTREVMARYGIDTEHVLRHYDVTGKRCPMPWVDDPAQWYDFKAMLEQNDNNDNDVEDDNMVKYKTIDDVPEWYRSEVQELIDAGALKGTSNGVLDISEDVVRGAIIGMRYAEAKNPHYATLDDVPAWAREDVQRMVDSGVLVGDANGKINLSLDMLRTLVITQRMMDGAAR